jgi:hypothetical protein
MTEAGESPRGKDPSLRLLRRGLRSWWFSYLAIGGMGPQARYRDEVAAVYKYSPGYGWDSEKPGVVFAYSLAYVFVATTTGGGLATFFDTKDLHVWQCFALALLPIAYFHAVYRGLRRQHFFMIVTITMWPVTIFLTRSVIRQYRRKIVMEVMEQ